MCAAIATATQLQVVSLLAVFVNKHVLSALRAPATLLVAAQSAFTAAASATQCAQAWRAERALLALPAALMFGASLTLSNYCLQLVPVYCFQLARALTVVLTFASAAVFGGERYTSAAVCGCGLVVVGFVGAFYDPAQPCGRDGFAVGAVGSVFTVAYAFAAQRLARALARDGGGNAELMFYCNAWVALLFALPSLRTLLAGAERADALPLASPALWAALLGSCVASVAVNYASVNQIARTSPLAHTLSTTVKAIVQTTLDALWRGAPLASLAASSLLVVVGSALYALSKRPVAQRRAGRRRAPPVDAGARPVDAAAYARRRF